MFYFWVIVNKMFKDQKSLRYTTNAIKAGVVKRLVGRTNQSRLLQEFMVYKIDNVLMRFCTFIFMTTQDST